MLLTDLLPGDIIRFNPKCIGDRGEAWYYLQNRIAKITSVLEPQNETTFRIFFDFLDIKEKGDCKFNSYGFYKYGKDGKILKIDGIIDVIELSEDN